jgi:hypothetical protein
MVFVFMVKKRNFGAMTFSLKPRSGDIPAALPPSH